MSGLSLGIQVNDFDLERVGFSLFVIRGEEADEAGYFRMTLDEMAWFVEALRAGDEIRLVAFEPGPLEVHAAEPAQAPRLPHVAEAGYPPDAAEAGPAEASAVAEAEEVESETGAADVIKLPWLSGWVGRREAAPAHEEEAVEAAAEEEPLEDPDDPRRLRIMRRPRKQPGLF